MQIMITQPSAKRSDVFSTINNHWLLKQLLSVLLLSLFILPAQAQWTKLGTDIDGESDNDFSGEAISLSDDGMHVAIGAEGSSDNGTFAGHVRIYEYKNGSWQQLGNDIDGDNSNDYAGGAVAISGDGKRVAVGARYHYNQTTSGSGQVRVFEYSGGSWNQIGNDLYGEADDDRFGYSISLSTDGSRLAVGAPENDGAADNAGHVRVFDFSGGSWSQVGSDISGDALDDELGFSVSLSGNGEYVVAGAPFNDDSASNAGHAKVYQYSNGSWTKKGNNIAGNEADDGSGQAVAIADEGSRVAIGAPGKNASAPFSGQVKVYEWENGSWSQLGIPLDGKGSNDFFGTSVDLTSDGSQVAIGAYNNDGNGYQNGAAYVYHFSNGSWSLLGSAISGEAANDEAGTSVAISESGHYMAVGAPGNDEMANDAGHVRVYEGDFDINVGISDVETPLPVDVSPNPFRETLTVRYQLNKPTNIDLAVYSIDGKIVAQQSLERRAQGIHHYTLPADALSSNGNMYLLRLSARNQVVTKRIIRIE